MNGQWFTIDDPSELQSGDIFQTPSKVPKNSPILPGFAVGAVKHVGIIVKKENGELHVAHNPFGDYPCLQKFEDVFKDRVIERIKRTGVSAEQILARLEEVKHLKYSFWGWNCEMFTRFCCGCSTGIDQRNAYATVLLILIILIILLLVIKK